MRFRTHVLAMALAAAVPAAAQQQQDFSQVEIKAEKVTDSVYMLTGRGGNIGLSVGKSGSFLVDDQFAPLTDKILAVVKSVSPEPGALPGQHALARRPHRRQREHGQGGRRSSSRTRTCASG